MLENTIRSWVEVDTGAMIQNLHYAKELTKGKKIMCVIKGDAHGHGAVFCGTKLEQNGADAFGVACLTEGIQLRAGGVKAPILILGWTPPECVGELAEYRLTQSILDETYAQELNKELERTCQTLDVHIKLDTGMSRTGLYAQENFAAAAQSAAAIEKLSHLHVTGIFTHFAAADMPEKDEFTQWQLDNFQCVLQELEHMGACRQIIRHAANSAGILYHPETHYDMVRMGVMLYGFYPNGVYEKNGPLKQALTLKARVAQVKSLPAGAHISYGCTAVTKRPSKIAVVTAGYADSYPRSLSNKGAYAVINGVRCPQVGRICMDMCMFDVTDATAHNGDTAILYGNGGMPMEEIANLTGSINCEPTCLLTNRVKRIYI